MSNLIESIQKNTANEPKKQIFKKEKLTFSGWWHAVSTFLSFFACISFIAWFFPKSLPSDEKMLLVMLGIGAACALITCGVYIIRITHYIAAGITKVLSAISVFAFIPFLPILVAVVTYSSVFAFCLGICVFIPYIITVVGYFIKLFSAKKDGDIVISLKKELITAAAGVLAAVAVFLILLTVRGVSVTATTLTMENVNPQQLYSEYISKNPNKAVMGIDIAHPIQSKYDAGSLSQDDVYQFETTINGVTYKNDVTVHYTYRDGKWSLASISESRDFAHAVINISSVFEGVGQFEGVISLRDFRYILTIDKLTKDGGSGSLIIHDDIDNVDITSEKCDITVHEIINESNDIVLHLGLTFSRSNDSGIQIDDIAGEYSVASGKLTTQGFFFDDDIVLESK